ncbi:MAG: diguanylate cyclase [Chloroflexi bacterium]|nr:diguanylate cyclase [Chloroflexota bacterium]
MYPGSLPFALPLFAIAILTAAIAIYAFSHQRQSGAASFGWLTTAMTVWSACYGLEILAPTLSLKILAAKLAYLGIISTPVFWLVFALEYTGHAGWLTRNKRLGLLGVSTITVALVFTNESHKLIWNEIGLDPNGYPSMVVLSHGLWFWVHTTISYGLVVAGIILYLVAYTRAHRIFRQQIIMMVAASFIPLVVNAVTLFISLPLHGFDLTSFTFAFSSIFLAIGLFRFNLINLIPIADALVIEHLHDAVIVMDIYRRIVDMNSAARTWLNLGNEIIGRDARRELTPLEPIWQKWETNELPILLPLEEGSQCRWFDITISPLRDLNKSLLGHVIIARDTSREHELLATARRHARQMEILNSITLASLETNTFQEMLQILADRLGELMEADGTSITLWNELEQKTTPAAAFGELRETYPAMKFEANETTLTESVLRAGHPLTVEDSTHSPYMSASISARFPGRSILALPLIAHEQKLGAALILFNQPHHFTEQEFAIGEQAAAQIALAFSKSQLFDSVSHRAIQLSLLNEVSRQMTESLDEREICERTVQAIVNVFGYDEAAISLLVGDDLELISVGGTVDLGYSPGFRQKVGQGIMGHVAETRESYFAPDVTNDPYYYHPVSEGSGSALGTPVLYEGKLLGAVYIQSAPPNPIFPEDIITMQTLASHLAITIQKAHLYAKAREHLTSMTTLQSVTETVTSSLELDNIFKTVVQLLKETYGYTYVSIYLLEDSTLRLGAQAGYPQELIIHEIPVNMGIAGKTVRTKQGQFIQNVRADPTFLVASYEVQSEICVPLLKNDSILGVLNIESDSNRPLTEKDMHLLTSFASPVAMAIDNARLHARVTSLVLKDGMTGLFNRRAFDQFLETEVNRAERYGHLLSLIILDMDSFKEYNDTYGHPAGDERLKAIAIILNDNVRDPDVAARYGGEEFAIILPHTTKEGATILAERLRETAEEQAPGEPGDRAYIPGYTISLGVATFPYDGDTTAALLRAADNAELNAKRLGKNRVCIAETSENLPSE